MEKINSVYIHANEIELSQQIKKLLGTKLCAAGFKLASSEDEADIIAILGGDGTLLRFLNSKGFPKIPIAGINTGHLGFFMEFNYDEIDEFIDLLKRGEYSLQSHRAVIADVFADGKLVSTLRGINDIVIRKNASGISHLKLSLGPSFIEHFSGDGIIVSSPAGSTSYNYSAGGSIVDPRVDLLQVTPIAPMNTAAYRSFISSVLLPQDMNVEVVPEDDYMDKCIVVADGAEYSFEMLEKVVVALDDTKLRIFRRKNYDFWTNVKEKFF